MSEENRRAGNALLNAGEPLLGLGVVIADEGFSFDGHLSSTKSRQFITNRIDIANEIHSSGGDVSVSDFQLSEYRDESIDYILLRLPKSKVLAQYLYGECERILKRGGYFLIAGYNQEGIKRVIKELSDRLGELVENQLLGKGLRLATIEKRDQAAKDQSSGDESLEDRALRERSIIEAMERYQAEHLLDDPNGEWQYCTKPGLYGFDKIDRGSQFLVEYLATMPRELSPKVLDLGCGYGYLSIHYASLLGLDSTEIVATDANIVATTQCEINFERFKINGIVLLDDCGSSLPDRSFKSIIANPPFHLGFTTSSLLTEKFIAATARLLKFRGSAYFVLNRFIAVEEICRAHQLRYEEVTANGQFKILHLTH